MKFSNRVTEMLGVEIPIIQAPMGWIARSRLASAVSNAGAMAEFGSAQDLYFGGDMEAAIPLSGQVCGRIDAVRPVAEIIAEVREQFFDVVGNLADRYPATA